jgi:hypothetical protein
MKISIAMCTYKGAQFLREQLDSLLAQHRLPDEVVIRDDASNDETLEILEKFTAVAPFKVDLSVNQTNLGAIRNFENAIDACTGDLIFLCDQDDVWRAEKIEAVEGAFESDPGISLVLSDAELVDSNLAPIGKLLFAELGFNPRIRELAMSGKRFDLLLKRNYFCGAAMAFRSSLKTLIRPIPDTGPLIHDGWIGLMISAVADVTFISQPLLKYRQHSAQQVGLAQVSTLEQVMRAQRTDRRFYTAQGAQLVEALGRLVAHGIDERNERILRQKIEHLNERAALPESQLRRLSAVGKEVMSLRYHRYSQGWFSAAKDLML